ncbi:kinase-like domain-containing protein, partial [Chlamydoabsidia padenii]
MAIQTQSDYWAHTSLSMVDKVIGNDYQLLEELGHGSYGCLFLGQSLSNNSYVAIKVLNKTGLDHEQLELQQLEIDIQDSIKHPHLLGLERVIHEKDHVFMVMELCDQGDLFDFVAENQQVRDDTLVKSVFIQILDGIQHLHSQGIYHRDIKLENILLKSNDDDGDGAFTCKVADFGLATRERYSLEFGCGSTTYLA